MIRYDNEEFLVDNWLGSISPIKSWMKDNMKYECVVCKNDGIHMNLKLKLQVDHINGKSNDNRKENLRWLCPNCHSQTKTYSGNNKCVGEKVSIKKENIIKHIDSCENINQLLIKIGASNTNANYKTVKKIFVKYSLSFPEKNRETIEDLFDLTRSKYDLSEISKLVWEIPMNKLCEKYSLSSNGLKKVCKRNNISFPSKGYWQRIQSGKTHDEALIDTEKKVRMNRVPMTQEQIEVAKKLHIDSKMSARKIAKYLNVCRNSVCKNLQI